MSYMNPTVGVACPLQLWSPPTPVIAPARLCACVPVFGTMGFSLMMHEISDGP